MPIAGSMSMGVFACPVTIIWIVGIVNAVNLIDGLDGLAGGIVFFAGVTNFVVAYVAGDVFGGALMATMLGAVLGFLIFNFNPARIFMGDSGSYFLGFILGTVSVGATAQKTSTAVSILVPILALGVPIFDTLFTMTRRILERRPIFSPDRGHVHHRLLDMGITHRRAVLILYGVSIVFTTAAIGVSLGKSWHIGVALLAASVVVIGMIRFLGYFEYLVVMRRQRARIRSHDTEALRAVLLDVPAMLAVARDDDGAWAALEAIAQRALLDSVELVASDGTTPIRAWASKDAVDPSESVSAKFPVGEDRHARAQLKFRWNSTSGDVSPQMEVLLQVVTDMVARAFVRLGSRHAPEPAKLAEPVVSGDRVSRPARAET
jgi:UDP-GlcNAc:undecaprenyl-phosphate GlcNAc-1-phosphate transferase